LGRLARLAGRTLSPSADLSRLQDTSVTAQEESRLHVRPRHVLLNFPLLVGGLIVLVLFLGVLFGPVLAPENPYLQGRRGVRYEDGVFHVPPFPPSSEHPLGTDELGRDTLSMLLHGARNTLVAAAFITMARLALGLVLGGLAGWHEGQLVDRLTMGAIQILASLPLLLIVVLLIFALDIRRGLPVFIIALCAIGWGEIAQYVRAEFIRIKQKPYLDSGRAIGLPPLGLAVRYVLPNVLPALVVITLLEMGAVLMILGELGFIGIYVGGGTSRQVDDFTRERYFSVPEWGAMMAGSHAWTRSRPWMVLFPAIAFFVSVIGFNLLGEGLRRLIDRGILNTAKLLSWRAILAAVLISVASVYVVLTLGPAPSYRHLAQQVNLADLMHHVGFLSSPNMEGRGVGSREARQGAEYIAGKFEEAGLTSLPGGWLREVRTTVARLAEPSELAVVDETGHVIAAFERWVDYGESTERHGGSGRAEAPVTLVLFASEGLGRQRPEERHQRFKGLDLRGRIALVFVGNAPADFDTEALIRGAEGVLTVSTDVRPHNQILDGDYLEHPQLPVFSITPEAADAILAGDGLNAAAIQQEIDALKEMESPWVARELDVRVRMSLQLAPPEEITMHNVLAVVDGSDADMADELVILSCHYDGLGRAMDGTLYPGANSNASGVAAMLEIAQLWQEQGFEPRRSVLFAAWAGGELPYSGAHNLHDRRGYTSHFDIVAVIHLDQLGSAMADGLVVDRVAGRSTLFELVESSAKRLGVDIAQGPALRHPYQRLFSGHYGTLVVTWGSTQPAWDGDTIESIDPQHLSQATEVINLALIQAAHEPRY
jgi:ABC-type dipeptide/oligopeptide/nickel transport system permease subunit